MKFVKLAIAAGALLSVSGIAQAQDNGAYVAVGVATYEFDTFGLDAKVGYNFGEYFGIEGQGILGLTSQTEDVFGTEVKAKVDSTIGGFGVVRLPAGENLSLFARGGYHSTSVSVETGTLEESGSFDGFAAGAGVTYNYSPLDGIRLEYTYLDAGDVGGNLNVVSLSYVRGF